MYIICAHPSIPSYYLWIYWANPMAWALQGLASIEFTSGKYDDFGDIFLETRGFQTGREWIGYSFAFMIPFIFVCTVILGVVLKYVRIEPEKQHIKKKSLVAMGRVEEESTEKDKFNLPFTPVDLTFKNLVYEVDASTSGEKLRLLNEVSGSFTAGRMCALMGYVFFYSYISAFEVILIMLTIAYLYLGTQELWRWEGTNLEFV
jgi:hypothetical protein